MFKKPQNIHSEAILISPSVSTSIHYLHRIAAVVRIPSLTRLSCFSRFIRSLETCSIVARFPRIQSDTRSISPGNNATLTRCLYLQQHNSAIPPPIYLLAPTTMTDDCVRCGCGDAWWKQKCRFHTGRFISSLVVPLHSPNPSIAHLCSMPGHLGYEMKHKLWGNSPDFTVKIKI